MNNPTAGSLNVKRLYRYQPYNELETRLRPALEGKLYCAPPGRFNDPWDCRPYFKLPDDPEELDKTIRWILAADLKHGRLTGSQLARLEHQLRSDPSLVRRKVEEVSSDIASDIDRSYRVCCFSSKGDRALMWSHYAQNHSGFCLEFSTCNDVLSLAYKVEYSSTYPAHDLTDDRDIRPFVSKSDVWEYECEYRFVGVVDGSGEAKDMDASLIVNSNNLLQLPAESLVSVIVGCQMPVSGCEEVRRLIERYDRRVQFKRAVRVPDRYDLVIELED